MINIAIFSSGEGTNTENLIQYFAGSTKVKITWVITNKEDAGVVARAAKHRKGIQLISNYVLENYADKFVEFLKLERIDLIILAGFLLKIPKELILAYPNRIINLHPSLLPKFGGKGMYGTHVHKAVLAAQEKESGISIHFVNEEYDTGELILQEKCLIEERETPESLVVKIHTLEHKFFPIAIERILEIISPPI
jgi:phosphoribosylglycinamide formyltransferase-1